MMRFKCYYTPLLVLAALVAATLAQIEDVPLGDEFNKLDYTQNFTSTTLYPRGGRIVNGMKASQRQFPYQARILTFSWCGAAIISDTYVLTAAHCVNNQGLQARHITVRIGTTLFDGAGGQNYAAESFLIHPRWNSQNLEFDVALIKTAGQMQLGDYNNAKTILLPPPNYNIPSGSRGILAGWGAISHNGPTSKELLYTTVPIVSINECRAVNGRIHESMLCAGGSTTGACFGDSGGPLVANGMVVGVASWVVRCGTPPYYGGYANVAHPDILNWLYWYLYWIHM